MLPLLSHLLLCFLLLLPVGDAAAVPHLRRRTADTTASCQNTGQKLCKDLGNAATATWEACRDSCVAIPACQAWMLQSGRCRLCSNGNFAPGGPAGNIGGPRVCVTDAPTSVPTDVPTAVPTDVPTDVPTGAPTSVPTAVPTSVPTDVPTSVPTDVPTTVPTDVPTAVPTDVPTSAPTVAPTAVPTSVPTDVPTSVPTDVPTAVPTDVPTAVPTDVPTDVPTAVPTTGVPTAVPTAVPTSAPTGVPTGMPTHVPTSVPTDVSTDIPTAAPTSVPTDVPTTAPTAVPTDAPSVATFAPTDVPTSVPTFVSTNVPTAVPTPVPAEVPTAAPTAVATSVPTSIPASVPTDVPTSVPTAIPTEGPTSAPTDVLTAVPTAIPAQAATAVPASVPTNMPLSVPTPEPTAAQTSVPTAAPTPVSTGSVPTAAPTDAPSPAATQTDVPAVRATDTPTSIPTAVPAFGSTATPNTATDVPPGIPPAVPPAVSTSAPNGVLTNVPATSVPEAIRTAVPTLVPAQTDAPANTSTPTPAVDASQHARRTAWAEAPLTASESVIETGGAVAATAAAVGGGAGGATRLAIASLGCHLEGEAQKKLPLIMHPTQLTILGSHTVGAVVGNTLVVVGFGMLCTAVLTVLRVVASDTLFRLFKVVDAQGFLRLPAAPFFVFKLLYQGTSFASLSILMNENRLGVLLIGVASTIVCVAVPALVLQKVRIGVPMFGRYDLDPTTKGALRWLIGPGEWVSLDRSREWVNRYSTVVREYRQEYVWYCAFELAIALFLSLLMAVRASSLVVCGHLKVVTGAVFMLLMLVEAVLWPHARPKDTVLGFAIAGIEAGAMVFMGIDYYEGHWPSDETAVFRSAENLMLTATIVVVLKLVSDVVAEVFILYTDRRERLQQPVYWDAQDSESGMGEMFIAIDTVAVGNDSMNALPLQSPLSSGLGESSHDRKQLDASNKELPLQPTLSVTSFELEHKTTLPMRSYSPYRLGLPASPTLTPVNPDLPQAVTSSPRKAGRSLSAVHSSPTAALSQGRGGRASLPSPISTLSLGLSLSAAGPHPFQAGTHHL